MRRIGTFLVAIALMGVWALAPAAATAGFTVSRVQGADRYGTAAAAAQAAFPGGAATVVMASGLNYPDALAGSYLAGTVGAPILLTDPSSVPASTLSALAALGAKTVDLLGGSSAVSNAVVTQLASTHSTSGQGGNLVVNRIAGPTRYDTAASIATSGGPIGIVNGQRTAIVVSGANFPDAVSAGPAAYAAHLPILLTDPASESSQTEAALTQLGITQVFVLGGNQAVSDTVFAQLATNHSRLVYRIAGADRTATAAAFYEAVEIPDLNFSTSTIYLANGTVFPAPDALAGAPLAGQVPAAILLSLDADTLGTSTTAELQNRASTLATGVILGGTAAISAVGQAAFITAAGGNASGAVTLTNTSTDAGGNITGFITAPTTVSSASVSGCGLNQAVPFNGSTGAFTLTVPASQPTGTCVLTFTITYNNGAATQTPSFTITIGTAITLNSSSASAGGTISGTVLSPATVGSLQVAGCGLAFQGVAFNASSGAFTLNIPNSQPSGTCTLNFTVNFNNGQPTETPSFTITITGSTASFVAPSLSTVTLTRANPPTTTNDSAVFTFNDTLGGAVPAASNFRLYRGASEYAVGIGLVVQSGATDTVQFPPGSATNVTLGSVQAGAVTDTSGHGNFPSSVSVAGAPSTLRSNEPDLLSVSAPTQGTGNYTMTFAFDSAVAVTPTVVSGTTYCTPNVATGTPAFAVVQASGTELGEASPGAGVPSAYTQKFVSGSCSATATSVIVNFTGTASTLSLSSAVAQEGRVQSTSGDHTGNPLGSVSIPSGSTPTFPVFQEALEVSPSPVNGNINIKLFFSKSVSPPGSGAGIDLIEGDGTEVAAAAAPTAIDSQTLQAVFPAASVAKAVGFAVVAGTVAGTQPDEAVVLTPQIPPFGQVTVPQLSGVFATAGSSGAGATVVFTFDENLSVSTSAATLPPSDFSLYTTTGTAIPATGVGNGTVSGNTVTFTCTNNSACAVGWTNAQMTTQVAGGVFDAVAENPPIFPAASHAG